MNNMEIPKGAQDAEDLKYKLKLEGTVDKVFDIFKEEQYVLHDISNIIKLIQIKLNNETNLLNINYIMNTNKK